MREREKEKGKELAKVRRGVVRSKRTNEEAKKNRSGRAMRCYIKSNQISFTLKSMILPLLR